VHVHSGLAADKAAQLADAAGLSEDDRAVIVLASMVHDFGKATHTQHVVDENGKVSITSQGHDEAGVEPAEAFLQSIGASKDVRGRIAPLVREHMCSNSVKGKPTRTAVRRLARRLAPATMDDWAMVTSADKGGRGTGSTTPDTKAWTDLYVEEKSSMKPLLRGEHLMAAGMKPSPEFAPIIAASLEAQDEGLFDDEAGAKEWFEANYSRTPR
jgi:tRNA nucleotidyltransferase (CCA-adding enzyme)